LKTHFNNIIKSSKQLVNEVFLFRVMADIFNTCHSKATFVKETHSHKGFVHYNSKIQGKIKKIEISDLLFITYNKSINKVRICFLQAKYKKTNYRKFLSFRGNVYQRELLKDKPDIIDTNNLGFPCNILYFTNYKSITAYGVFYYDKVGDIDFLYTLPHFLKPKNIHVPKGDTPFHFQGYKSCPNVLCSKGILKDETISTCSLDVFQQEVLKGHIGAPVNGTLLPVIRNMISLMREQDPENSVIEEMQGFINESYNGLTTVDVPIKKVNYCPNAILLITDGLGLE
jgi:hypothetical protein